MKKRSKNRKFSRTANERKQLFRGLINELVSHGYVVTSETKAKAVRPIAEKLVTIAKENSLTSLRRLTQETGNIVSAREFLELGSLFVSRPGGYLRIIRLANQQGDDTVQVKLEWVEKLTKSEVVVPKKESPVDTEKEIKEIAEAAPKKTEEKPAKKKVVKTKTKTAKAKAETK